MPNYRLILETGEIVLVELKIEDIRTHINGFPENLASKKYKAIFPGSESKKIIILLNREQTGEWRDDRNPTINGTMDQRNALKKAIENINA